jgi:hypothetical protein
MPEITATTTRRLIAIALAFCSWNLAPHGAAAQPYDLTLGREIKPFDQYMIEALSTRISKVNLHTPKGPMVLQNDTVRSVLSGNCNVEAVTEDGQEAVKNVSIRNAQSRNAGKSIDILPTGTLVHAAFSNDGNVYTVKGDTVKPEVAADLIGLIRSEGGLKSGEIMNPRKPVNVGESWPIDTAAFARTLGDPPANRRRKISGTVKFERIDTVGGIPVAVVNMNARADNAIGEIDGSPTSASTITANIELTVPLDKRFPAVQVATRTNMTAELGEADQKVHVEYLVSDQLNFIR